MNGIRFAVVTELLMFTVLPFAKSDDCIGLAGFNVSTPPMTKVTYDCAVFINSDGKGQLNVFLV